MPVLIPTIKLEYKPVYKEDKKPYLAHAFFSDGTNYHANGESPQEAMIRLAYHWAIKDNLII